MADGADKADTGKAQKAGEAGNAEARAVDFDAAAFEADLLALNPWFVPFEREIDDLKTQGLWDGGKKPYEQNPEKRAVQERFAQARRQAMLARWGAGKDAWNAWAEPMLALKARLEAAVRWEKDANKAGPEQRRYRALAHTDFTELCLPGDADFSGFAFPGMANFSETQFGEKEASSGFARFDGAQFSKSTFLNNARFMRIAQFRQAVFDGPVNLTAAQFEDSADFTSIHSKVGFDLTDARFKQVPSFIQASFHREPRLDNVKVRPSRFGTVLRANKANDRWHLFGQAIDRDAPAKFRELKHYAIDGEDHRSELMFHAEEIRSSRFVTDWPWTPRYWFGYLYSTFSDFGRSILRPLLVWLLLVGVCTGFYLGQSPHIAVERAGLAQEPGGTIAEISGYAKVGYAALTEGRGCRPANTGEKLSDAAIRSVSAGTDAVSEALALSIKNALVFIDWDRAEAARRTFGCLYGFTTDGSNTYPNVPPVISAASILQNIISAILIFLFLLALRNLLKLK